MILAAQKLGRQWDGIDGTHLAMGVIEQRLRDPVVGVDVKSHGVPQESEGARKMAGQCRAFRS